GPGGGAVLAVAVVVVVQAAGGGHAAQDHILQVAAGGALVEPGDIVGVDLDIGARGGVIADTAHVVGGRGGAVGLDHQGALRIVPAVAGAVRSKGQAHRVPEVLPGHEGQAV